MGRFAIIVAAGLWSGLGPTGCHSPSAAHGPVEAVSLLGTPLFGPPLEPATAAGRQRQLAQAEARFQEHPASEIDLIWVGRRLAYLGRYGEAIEVYTDGLRTHPGSYRLRRHRGHRLITVRRLDDAISDLALAAELSADVPDEVEADGLPNARNIPTSTTKSNIYYHLGLARYLSGRLGPALTAYRTCMEFSNNDDMRCATSYWLYLTLRRLGRDDEARGVLDPITPDMQIIENFAYRDLLLLFKGQLAPRQVLNSDAEPGPVGQRIDDATRGYGVGAWHLVNGRRTKAMAMFRGVVRDTAWPAFGHIAAEAELARTRAEPQNNPGDGAVP